VAADADKEVQEMTTAHSLSDRPAARTREWHQVTPKMLRERIIPVDRPAVLKGAVKDWPIVRTAHQSLEALGEYLRERDRGRPVRVMLGPPQIGGAFSFGMTSAA
jgi:hypothetical protein